MEEEDKHRRTKKRDVLMERAQRIKTRKACVLCGVFDLSTVKFLTDCKRLTEARGCESARSPKSGHQTPLSLISFSGLRRSSEW